MGRKGGWTDEPAPGCACCLAARSLRVCRVAGTDTHTHTHIHHARSPAPSLPLNVLFACRSLARSQVELLEKGRAPAACGCGRVAAEAGIGCILARALLSCWCGAQWESV